MLHRNIVLLLLGLITCYDILTTIIGTIEILGEGFGSITASTILGILIGGLLYFSYEIHRIKSTEFLPSLAKPLWFLALGYDLWTAFTGNNKFIIRTELTVEDFSKIVILIGLTIFVTACPIILSYLRNNEEFMTYSF